MKEPVLIGIDAGTSYLKAVAYGTGGEALAEASVQNEYKLLSGGRAEQDLDLTFAKTVSIIQRLKELIPDLAERTLALAVTGQGDGTWLIDKDGKATSPALLWLDARSAEITKEFVTRTSYAEHFQSTGCGISPCQQSSQLAWFKKHKPEVLNKSVTAFHCKDWIYFKLTDARFTDPSEGNFTFGNYRTREYNWEIVENLGLKDYRHLIPPMLDGSKESHPMKKSVADLVGLKEGTPVVLGFVDVICSGLGSGLFDSKRESGCTIIGSTGIHMKYVENPDEITLNPRMTGYTMCFPHGKSVVKMQSNMSATINADWFAELFREKDDGAFSTKDFLVKLDECISELSPTCIFYHPCVSEAGERGPFMNPDARAGFIGIDQNTNREKMLRSIYEGIAYAARDCYSAIGGRPKEVRISGGFANSKSGRHILADILGAKIRVSSVKESGATGAAMIAAVQLKIFDSMIECSKEWVEKKLEIPTDPDEKNAKIYDELFDIYSLSIKSMPEIWSRLNNFKTTVTS